VYLTKPIQFAQLRAALDSVRKPGELA